MKKNAASPPPSLDTALEDALPPAILAPRTTLQNCATSPEDDAGTAFAGTKRSFHEINAKEVGDGPRRILLAKKMTAPSTLSESRLGPSSQNVAPKRVASGLRPPTQVSGSGDAPRKPPSAGASRLPGPSRIGTAHNIRGVTRRIPSRQGT